MTPIPDPDLTLDLPRPDGLSGRRGHCAGSSHRPGGSFRSAAGAGDILLLLCILLGIAALVSFLLVVLP